MVEVEHSQNHKQFLVLRDLTWIFFLRFFFRIRESTCTVVHVLQYKCMLFVDHVTQKYKWLDFTPRVWISIVLLLLSGFRLCMNIFLFIFLVAPWSCRRVVGLVPLLFWNILSLLPLETNGINNWVPDWPIKKPLPASPDKSSWNWVPKWPRSCLLPHWSDLAVNRVQDWSLIRN